MPWTEYEAIRSGKSTLKIHKNLENTSLVIQSVIGAGNNRVTSLGLAMLSSALYQGANTGKVMETKLFKTKGSFTPTAISSSEASKIVLQGMQKVMTPSEPGWVGDGTGNGAFKFVFGKPCGSDCPIYAKTGTVSFKDVNHSGTTLFTSVVKENELKKFLGIKQNSNKRILAIGVICAPKKKNTGHHASKLGLLLIKELINQTQ
jgi:cell division protein FtsI/penicillin-binding protein 2